MPASTPVTVITGASAGIGEAFAGIFAAHGRATVLVARRLDRLEAIAKRIVSGGGATPLILAIDLAQPGGADELARALAEARAEPEILVNNAGFGLRGTAANLDRALFSYNPDDRYVQSIKGYAEVMLADARTYAGYHAWQVYYATRDATYLLPEGYPQVAAVKLPPTGQ